jgi:amino acid transporter
VCGLATLTAASRLAWAMARDDGLPFSRRLRRIGSHHTPSTAIWSVCGVAVFFLLAVKYDTVAAVCAAFLYIAYVVPTAWGLLTYGRWPATGPWRLGRWYRPLAAVCVAWCVLLIVISVQPPNQIAAPIIGALVVALVGLWFGWMRRHFRRAAPAAVPGE